MSAAHRQQRTWRYGLYIAPTVVAVRQTTEFRIVRLRNHTGQQGSADLSGRPAQHHVVHNHRAQADCGASIAAISSSVGW